VGVGQQSVWWDLKDLFMKENSIFSYIQAHCDEIVSSGTRGYEDHWRQFVHEHPADIAETLLDLSVEQVSRLFVLMPHAVQVEVFGYVPDAMKVGILSNLSDKDRSHVLHEIPLDELTDLFERLTDKELEHYLPLLSKKERKQVLALMEFDPESAGGIMETEVLTLMKDFTVSKAIHILQRLQPRLELHHIIFITNQENKLEGHIKIEDLVVNKPHDRLASFMHRNPLVLKENEDQEKIVQEMRHYELNIAPVVSMNDYFLGIISSDQLIEVIEQEAREDVHKMSAMPAIKYPYFETPFSTILFQRSYILVALLLAQSLSGMIYQRYEALLTGFLTYFITMLLSTGGNSSSQTSALAIQGMVSGEITENNMRKFLAREFRMACVMALILGVVSFGRAVLQGYLSESGEVHLLGCVAVSISLSLVVMVSIMLGSLIPILLKKLNMDPAFAAGPFLATIMDILGLLIYCGISSVILG
jgi:magnesium transporter